MRKIKYYNYLISLFFIIFIYYFLSNYINKEIILPKVNTIFNYIKSLKLPFLFKNSSMTITRTLIGYIFSIIFALLLAIIASYKQIGKYINPLVSITKTIPTISIIIIALIWLGKERSIYLVGFLVVFPLFYEMFFYNINNIDKKLLEVCQIYKFTFKEKIKYLYFYNIIESLILSLKQTFGLAFKVMVMSEVIGQAKVGIGAQIYNEKVNLEMSGVFIWTIILIIIVLVLDYLIDNTSKKLLKWKW